MIKVVIADDIQILRQGLKAILSQDPEISVTGLAADGKEAFELCRKERPDVVLMDMRMPGYDGSWGIEKIKGQFPEIKVLVLTTFDDTETVEAAVGKGADGYILKEMEDEKVIQSVKAVCMGVRVFGGSVFDGMRKQMTALEKRKPERDRKTEEKIGTITERERDIMGLVARGMDNKEIAAELFLAEGTVRNHISRILEKLELKDRTQLAVFTVKNRLDEE
ncbi:response regulator transcription factor [Lachnospiraceae bacterium 45-P1]